ncbi:YtxH domain-containing protein [Nocardioides zeae]|uniref:YtxH domain-containing protein n=1 Tax=Nocardioides zeae TaxID=1457234 RepID=A0A6P0HJH7_9ACTN|nr:YtxH domain-containing protein [Nocardioides zeae]NEN78394.1 YtxH domain-containing protein [Nocardioides zeae]
MRKLTLVIGIGIGYVLGARAGTQRYEQLKAQAQKAWNNPTVQDKVDQAQEKVKETAPQVAEKVSGKASEVAHTVTEKVRGEDSTDDGENGGAHAAGAAQPGSAFGA